MHSKALHGQNSTQRQRARKILAKRGTELLCELELLEPTIEWIEEEDVELDFSTENFQLTVENEEIIINDLHEWLVSPFVNLDSV